MDRETLLGLVVCPWCRDRLERAASLDCRRCGRSYPLEAGVPVFLDLEQRRAVAEARADWGGERVTTARNERWIARLRWLVPRPAPFLNRVSGPNLARLDRLVREGGSGPWILDLGSGGGAGAGLDRIGRDLREKRTVCMDIDRFSGVDLVAGGERLPFADGTFRAVLLKAVLEHVPDPAAVVGEAGRVLEPGGILYVEVPFLFEYHPNPGDYTRYTRAGLEHLLAPLDEVEVGTLVGPFAAVSSLLAQATSLALSGGSRLARKGLLPWLTWIFWPLSLPDLWVARLPASHFAAHHLYAFARKPRHGG